MTNKFSHIPVLLTEAVDALKVRRDGKYIDATFGGGGHSQVIIEKGGIVLGIDQDLAAIDAGIKNLESRIKNHNLKLALGNFADIKKIATENGFEKVSGILLDLGVSSYQLDSAERGFSFRHDEKLDMRMNSNGKLTAFDVVNFYPKENLVEIFLKYGEEHSAKEIAEAIVGKRKKEKIYTTKELVKIVMEISHKSEPINPATRIFQAIRIEVNDEIESLKKGLSESLKLLNGQARLVVISFHSLEDRVVKQIFDKSQREGFGKNIYKRPVVPSSLELSKNRRARSAKMRVFEKN